MSLNISELVTDWLHQKLSTPSPLYREGEWVWRPSASDEEGDISLDVALRLSKTLRVSPQALSQELAHYLMQQSKLRCEALRGFVNISFPRELLIGDEHLGSLLEPRLDRSFYITVSPQLVKEIEVRLPRQGLSRLGLLRYVTFPLMQALAYSGRCNPQRVRVGTWLNRIQSVEDVVQSLQEIKGILWSESLSETPFLSSSVTTPQWRWIAEDSEIPVGPGITIGCNRLLLLHMPREEEEEFAQIQLTDNFLRSFIWYAISPQAGTDFIPSACLLAGRENLPWWLAAMQKRIVQRQVSSCVVKGANGEFPASLHRMLIHMSMLPYVWRWAGDSGCIEVFGERLFRLALDLEYCLNCPRVRALQDAENRAVTEAFSYIYRAIGDVLTIAAGCKLTMVDIPRAT